MISHDRCYKNNTANFQFMEMVLVVHRACKLCKRDKTAKYKTTTLPNDSPMFMLSVVYRSVPTHLKDIIALSV